MNSKKVFSEYLSIFFALVFIDKIFLNFADLSNDTNLLAGIASNPFASLNGESPEPQMPPLLGLALYPAHLLSVSGMSFIMALRSILFLYSLVTVFLLAKIFVLNSRANWFVRIALYVNLSVIVLILNQEDILGYLFIAGVVLKIYLEKFRTALFLLVIASLVAKILFLVLILPLAYFCIRNQKLTIVYATSISLLSPLVWVVGILQYLNKGQSSILDFKLPMFYSASFWSFLSQANFLSEENLRILSALLLFAGIVVTIFAIQKDWSFRLIFSLNGIWMLFCVYQIQPEYMFLALPLILMSNIIIQIRLNALLFPLAFLQNFLFSFSSQNSSILSTPQKMEYLKKITDSLPILKSNIPSQTCSILFSCLLLFIIWSSFLNKSELAKNS